MENNRIGALWQKEKFMSGEIEIDGKKIRIIVFPNTRKTKENQPDHNILISRPRPVDSIQAPNSW